MSEQKKRGPRPKSEFYKLRRKSFFVMDERCAEYFGVDVLTIHQWDTEGAPVMAMKLLMMRLGHLSAIHGDWVGFHICENGILWGPNRARHPAWTLRRKSDYQEALDAAEREARTARDELERLRRLSTPEAVQKASGRLIWVPDYVH